MEIHPDILSVIFDIYAFDIDGHVGTLVLVCKRWMHVARSMSRLWSRINITADEWWCSPRSTGATICRTQKRVEATLRWSKMQPLEFVMAIGMKSSISTCSPENRASLFQFVVERYGGRIARLTIDVMLQSQEQIQEVELSLQNVFMWPLPLLKFLEITPCNVPNAVYRDLFDMVTSSSTQLGEIIVSKDCLRELVKRGFDSRRMNKNPMDLTIYRGQSPGFTFSLLSTISTKLRYLTIYDHLADNAPQPLQFPKLRRLSVGFLFINTLSQIRFPILTRLFLLGSIIEQPTTLPRGFLVLPSLKFLHVQGITPSITYIHAPSLIALSIETPCLDTDQTTRDFEEIFTNYDGFHTTRYLWVRFSFSKVICPRIEGLAGLRNIKSLCISSGREYHLYVKSFWLSLSPDDDKRHVIFPKLTTLTIRRDLFKDESKMAKQMMSRRNSSPLCTPLIVYSIIDTTRPDYSSISFSLTSTWFYLKNLMLGYQSLSEKEVAESTQGGIGS